MKISNIIFGITLLLLTSCEQGQIKTPEKAMTKFEEFKSKEKFIEDSKIFYSGIADPKLKPILTEKLNLAVNDFKRITETGNGTDRFSHIYI